MQILVNFITYYHSDFPINKRLRKQCKYYFLLGSAPASMTCITPLDSPSTPRVITCMSYFLPRSNGFINANWSRGIGCALSHWVVPVNHVQQVLLKTKYFCHSKSRQNTFFCNYKLLAKWVYCEQVERDRLKRNKSLEADDSKSLISSTFFYENASPTCWSILHVICINRCATGRVRKSNLQRCRVFIIVNVFV
jgi:hypothetical protein